MLGKAILHFCAIFLHFCQIYWSSISYLKSFLGTNTFLFMVAVRAPGCICLVFPFLSPVSFARYHLCSALKTLLCFPELPRQPKLCLLPLSNVCVTCQTGKSDSALGDPNIHPHRLVSFSSNLAF